MRPLDLIKTKKDLRYKQSKHFDFHDRSYMEDTSRNCIESLLIKQDNQKAFYKMFCVLYWEASFRYI